MNSRLIERQSLASRNDWSLADIGQCLHENRDNTLTYHDKSGVRRCVDFRTIYRHAIATRLFLEEAGCVLGSDARLGIAGAPGYEWLLVTLACMLSGTEIVALPETLLGDELEALVAELEIDSVACDDKVAAGGWLTRLPHANWKMLCDAVERTAEVPQLPARSSRISIVAFTSGSTAVAKLKAFRIRPESTEAFIKSFVAIFRIAADDNWLICHPFSHIVHLEYALGGLCQGYNVVLASPLQVILAGGSLDPAVLIAVPSVYEQLLSVVSRRLPKRGLRVRLLNAIHSLAPDRVVPGIAWLAKFCYAGEIASVVGNRLKVMIIGAAPSGNELKRRLMLYGLPVYEGYGMSETNMLACNTPSRHRLGTVGPVWPGVELRVGDNGKGTLQARLAVPRTDGYLNVPAAENQRMFLDGGWIDTGDNGQLEGGFVQVTGRQKELIVTDRGKKINPSPIELLLAAIPGITHALVYGDRRPFLVAVLAPAAEGSAPPPLQLDAHVQRVNERLPAHERILDYVLLDSPLSEENGCLTRSGKPRRAIVEQRHASRIEALYE